MNTNSKCKENLLSLKIFAKIVLYLEHDLFAFFKNDKTSSIFFPFIIKLQYPFPFYLCVALYVNVFSNSQCFKSLGVSLWSNDLKLK